MQLDASPNSASRGALDASLAGAARTPLARPLDGDDGAAAPGQAERAAQTARKGPPRLVLGAASNRVPPPLTSAPREARPSLTIQPASPAMSPASPLSMSPTEPFPPPVPSTSAVADAPASYAPSFQPPPSPFANGGGLAARRAAKLGKKRLSLVVPPNPHSSLPTSGPDASSSSLLSPLTPSYLRPSGANLDPETRSLPPSPVSLTTFIGPEGSEAPDRTIGRLMLKQQADEMREQMRGGRGMRRRTSIPRLNLVKTGVAAAQPANLDEMADAAAAAHAPSGGASVVQLLRGDAVERRAADGAESDEGPVEEFPYALGPREILPGVFLGSEQNAKDAAVLREWKIGFVLNVAKEVDCPWLGELDLDEDEEGEGASQEVTPVEAPGRPAVPSPPRATVDLQRRTTTQVVSVASAAATPIPSPSGVAQAPRPPVRPPFIRPTASTPNLHAAFQPLSINDAPPVPPLPSAFLPSPLDSEMQRSLSSSPPQARRPAPRARPRRSKGPATTTRSRDAIRCPRNARSGRPALEYLWLKWGHDEADLVEAHKFQAAFDFLDEARERGERVLVHCQCGVSRSATVVIAYCMREAAKALEEGRDAAELAGCTGMHDTYSFVKEKSEWVGPNLSLVFQLVAYERTLRGDNLAEDVDEPPYPHSATRSPVTVNHAVDDDLPPPTPAHGFSPFAFPPARPTVNPLPSPRTPVSSEGSMAESQLSTPDLHDPLISPTFSAGTKASSVTSTPLSAARLGLPVHPVRIVRPGEDAEDERDGVLSRDRHSSLETVISASDAHDPSKSGKGVFVLPVPPRSGYSTSFAEEAVSPTIALYPPGTQSLPPQQQRTQLNSFVHPTPLRTSSLSKPALSIIPTLSASASPVRSTPATPLPPPIITTSPISPAKRQSLSIVTTPISPALSNSSALKSSSRSSHSNSSSGGGASPAVVFSPQSAVSTSTAASGSSSLSRTSSGRRFGAGQTPSERRASHRRVCSDTIRVPTPGLHMSAATPVSTPAAREEGDLGVGDAQEAGAL
ncbi:uncharacterized protein JCM10292_000191 [Rhodotorula paludigena]|uniref:uncharacterized protein n=1 Tax=Rhodotorula paludigena TaxID=86838 RepID=UPI0031770543